MQTLDALTGEWKLVYTSASEALAVLALSRLPFVTIGDITQNVDALSNTVENKVRRRASPQFASGHVIHSSIHPVGATCLVVQPQHPCLATPAPAALQAVFKLSNTVQRLCYRSRWNFAQQTLELHKLF
jgi:hypothetical protein